nr:hypothetical protein [Myxococcota bacterium]
MRGLSPDDFERPFREWFTLVSPHYLYPRWLHPAARLFHRAELAMRGQGPPVRAVVSTPTQHGKSTLAQHALAYTTGRNLNKSHIYASYGVTLAKRNSRSTLN